MPDPSELFTNVYVKGLGTEVKFHYIHLLLGDSDNNIIQGSLNYQY